MRRSLYHLPFMQSRALTQKTGDPSLISFCAKDHSDPSPRRVPCCYHCLCILHFRVIGYKTEIVLRPWSQTHIATSPAEYPKHYAPEPGSFFHVFLQIPGLLHSFLCLALLRGELLWHISTRRREGCSTQSTHLEIR